MDAAIARRPATRAEARALSHPLRLRILRLCLDQSMTNRELAARLGEQPATILYHVRTLLREGFLVREPERRGRRGSRELPYRSTRKSLSLDFGLDTSGNLAVLDAARAELVEAGPDQTLVLSRLAVRLAPEHLHQLVDDMQAILPRAAEWDDPAGEPIALLVLAHRRA